MDDYPDNPGPLPIMDFCNKNRPNPILGKGPLGRADNSATYAEEDHDDRIRHLQLMLKTLGYNIGLHAIDGKFGPDTEKAVKQFQSENKDWEKNKLEVDGLAGPTTADALNRRMVGRWYDFYETPRKATKNNVLLTLTKSFLDQEVKIERGDALGIDIIMTSPPFFDYEWRKEEGAAITLYAKTTLPDDTPVKFIVYESKKQLTFPLPDSSTGRPRPELGSELAVLTGKIANGSCSAQWTPENEVNPFDYHSWLIDLDVELALFTGKDDEIPEEESEESSAGLYSADSIRQPFFCVESGEHWGFSSPPGFKLNDISFENADELSGIAISTDGTLLKFDAKSTRINTHDFIEILSLAVRGESISEESSGDGVNG